MQQGGQALHRFHPGRIGIGPERHRTAGQRRPVRLGDRLGAIDPAEHHVLREQTGSRIGSALTFHHQDRGLWTLQQIRQSVERPGGGPVAGEGIAAAGAMPVPIQPDAMQEGLAAAAQPDPLNPEQHLPGGAAVGPLGGGAAVQRRRWGTGGRLLGHAPGLAVAAGALAGISVLAIGHQAKEGLHLPGGLHKAPALPAHQQVHAGAGATALVLAAALVAEPGAAAVLVVKAVAIRAATKWTGLMAIPQLRFTQPCQGSKDLRPAAVGRSNGIRRHGLQLTIPGRQPLLWKWIRDLRRRRGLHRESPHPAPGAGRPSDSGSRGGVAHPARPTGRE